MIDWTKQTSDPLDSKVRNKLKDALLAMRKDLPKNNYEKFLVDQIKGKTVLDIGICEHTMERMNSPNWKHRIIKENAKRCVGLDILEDLVAALAKKGFDVLCQDATSDAFIGETFDLVHIGDVIEHVSDPAKLLAFAARHLAPGGKILVRTPNPHNFDYYKRAQTNGVSVENMEHVSYIVPFHAIELARRTGLEFQGYWTMAPGGLSKSGILRSIALTTKLRFLHILNELFGEPNSYTTIFVYAFSKKSQS